MLSGQGSGGGRCLFTASQWQELEHQALIYKYMVTGTPVPPDLVLPLRHRDGFAIAIDTAPSLAFPPHQPSLGWGCYEAAAQCGRKADDPEPGRCRRTDGKKWRCSREVYGDSKYCEKHMHRGKNRSRKPVETMSSAGAGASYLPSALSISPPAPDSSSYGHQHHIGRADASSARAPSQISPLQLRLDAAAHAMSPPSSYHRYAQYSTSPLFPSGYGYGSSKEHDEAEVRRRQHFLAFGADLSLDKPAAAGHDAAAATEKPLRRFFDEWPRETSDERPWMGADQDETQLSISIPTALPDLAVAAASRYHNADE